MLIDLKSEYITARNRYELIGDAAGGYTMAELTELSISLGWLTKKIKDEERKLFVGSKSHE